MNELQKIEKINKFVYSHKPKINNSSKHVNRGVNDLLEWGRRKDVKLNQEKHDMIEKQIPKSPFITPMSKEILQYHHPEYLSKKVEDRLTEKGIKTKVKIEVLREEIFNTICRSKSAGKLPSYREVKNVREGAAAVITKIKPPIDINSNPNSNSIKKLETATPQNKKINEKKNRSQTSEKISPPKKNENCPIEKKAKINQSVKKQITNKESFDSNKIIEVRKHLHNYLNGKNLVNENKIYNNVNIPRPFTEKLKNTIIHENNNSLAANRDIQTILNEKNNSQEDKKILNKTDDIIPNKRTTEKRKKNEMKDLPKKGVVQVYDNNCKTNDLMKLNQNAKNFLVNKIGTINNSNIKDFTNK
jgi:hypothetical protein